MRIINIIGNRERKKKRKEKCVYPVISIFFLTAEACDLGPLGELKQVIYLFSPVI